MCGGVWLVVWVGRQGADFDLCFSLFYWENRFVVERIFEYNRGMELGDPTATTPDRAVDWMRPSTPSMQLSPT